jgi:hypothetical protein
MSLTHGFSDRQAVNLQIAQIARQLAGRDMAFRIKNND